MGVAGHFRIEARLLCDREKSLSGLYGKRNLSGRYSALNSQSPMLTFDPYRPLADFLVNGRYREGGLFSTSGTRGCFTPDTGQSQFSEQKSGKLIRRSASELHSWPDPTLNRRSSIVKAAAKRKSPVLRFEPGTFLMPPAKAGIEGISLMRQRSIQIYLTGPL